ncbi:AraC family transcriptional regulator [Streptomyces winkii]|uniref:AraC family transcriptional regulator n=1 Tax=Streptomyces winkii TaxID=3051178 RepID=UPI0028D4B8AC|nr:AraC family transcriptional regulator [Streptomyces sp. DSM 40971]
MDLLSDITGVMRTGRPSASRLRVGSPWSYRFAPYDGAGFHVVVCGSGWLLMDQRAPVRLGTGDVVLMPSGRAHVLSDSRDGSGAVPFETAVADPDGNTEFLCGKYRLERHRTHPLLAMLPDVVHLPARVGDHRDLRSAVDLLGSEATGRRPGRDAAIAGLLDLLLVYMIRAWFDDHRDGDGRPRLLSDHDITAALEALHGAPARQWRIEDLAAEIGLSRATLARRFTESVGQPPMAYLTQWRMTLAARLLRETELALAAVARQVGYASPFAFSHAFKREFGMAPARYREDRQKAQETAAPHPPLNPGS